MENKTSKSGSHHWLWQRITALFLIALVVWLFCFISQITGKNVVGIMITLKKPYNIALLTLMTIMLFYHSVLGMQVVIEDYIGCRCLRFGLIMLTKIFSIVTVIFLIVALFYLMAL